MNDNFKGKRNTNGFDKNPQNINRKGRKKKGFAQVNDELDKLGYEQISKPDYVSFLRYMMQATEEDLKKLATDPRKPMYMRLMITELKNVQTRSAFMKDIRDCALGKSENNVNHNVKARLLSKDEIKDFIQNLEDNY